MELERIELPTTFMRSVKSSVNRLPIANVEGRVLNPGNALLHLDIQSSAPEVLTYNKWGGIITWTKNYLDMSGVDH